ncbi:MAG: STAS domain-containing protein [Oscillospiraceae bacterium]|nr:STAS domain-containing protein [Oscillospiraceae bacterium]
MNITQKATGEQLILEIEGRIDTKTTPSLETVIQTALEGIRSLVIDLAETVYISSAGLRVILMAQKQMNRQGDMKVIHVSSDLMDIFEVTGFADILTIE